MDDYTRSRLPHLGVALLVLAAIIILAVIL